MRKHHTPSKKFVLSLLFLTAVFGLSVQFAAARILSLQPLANLSIPHTHLTYLPNPLEFIPILSAVLGAQTIEGADIINYVNIERGKKGAKPLVLNPTLTQAAQLRADVILKHQNFSHQDPFEGIELLTVLPRLNYYFRYASENIGMGGVSAQDFVGGFMNSTAHRTNLLNPQLVESGVAVVTGPYKQYYVNIAVQLFAVPSTREDYLGYSSFDRENYGTLLTDINGKISFARFFIEKGWGDQTYYKGWEILLLRQKEILDTVYKHMIDEKPLGEAEKKLIQKYNANWQTAPQI